MRSLTSLIEPEPTLARRDFPDRFRFVAPLGSCYNRRHQIESEVTEDADEAANEFAKRIGPGPEPGAGRETAACRTARALRAGSRRSLPGDAARGASPAKRKSDRRRGIRYRVPQPRVRAHTAR